MCLDQFEVAIPFYNAALRVSPRDPQRGVVLIQLANVQMGLKNDEKALKLYRLGIPLVPKFYLPRTSYAICFAKLNRWSEADAELQKAISLQPSLSLKTFAESTGFVEGARLEDSLKILRQIGLWEE